MVLSTWIFYSCSKVKSIEQIDSLKIEPTELPVISKTTMNLTNAEISSLAKSIGYLHNALIDKVDREVDLRTISKQEYKKAFYAAKIERYNYTYVDSKIVFDKTGIDQIDSYINNKFSKSTKKEIEYIKQICHAVDVFTTESEKNILFDELLNSILNDLTLNVNTKVMLTAATEVGRASMLYWYKSKTDKNNPYYKAFYSNATNYLPTYPFGTCESYIDMSAFLIAYNEYISNGYTPEAAGQAAGYDGGYQSGLAGMPGGACNNNSN